MIKNKYVAFGLFILFFCAFWNLLEYLYSAFITHSAWQFTAGLDLGAPFLAAVIIGCLLFLRGKGK